MPKIRGIKPDFWTDEDVMDLTIPARLLFIGLWNYACDNGHLQDKPKQIKMRLLPADDINVTELLRELVEKGRLKRGDGWLTIPNLGSHQKIDTRYFTTCDKADCEDPPEKVSKRESRRAPAGTRGHTAVARGDGDGEVMVIDGDGDSRATGTTKRASSIKDSWRPNGQHLETCALHGLDPNAEGIQFRDYHRAKGTTMKDWDAAFRNWLRKAVEYGRGKPALVVVADGASLPPAASDNDWMKRRPR